MPLDGPAEPWLSFLTELDAQLDAPVDFHCIGGFVVSQHYGLGRETADLFPVPEYFGNGSFELTANAVICLPFEALLLNAEESASHIAL